MKSIRRIAAVATLALAIGCAGAKPMPLQFSRSNVSLSEKRADDVERYRVQGAVGHEKADMDKVASVDAIAFAARMLAGDKGAAARAESAVLGSVDAYLPFAVVVQQLGTKMSADGENMVGELLVDVNVGKLRAKLEESGAIESMEALSEAVADLKIMVLPEGMKPSDDTAAWAQQAAATINQLIMEHGWKLVSPKGVSAARDRNARIDAVAGNSADAIKLIASEAGAQVYVTFTASLARDQANATLNAYNVSSGELLGSTNGITQKMVGESNGNRMVEVAVRNAMPKLISQITTKWAAAKKQGRSVKFYFTSEDGSFDGDGSDALYAALKQFGKVSMDDGQTANSMEGELKTKLDPQELQSELANALRDAGFSNVSREVSGKDSVRFKVSGRAKR